MANGRDRRGHRRAVPEPLALRRSAHARSAGGRVRGAGVAGRAAPPAHRERRARALARRDHRARRVDPGRAAVPASVARGARVLRAAAATSWTRAAPPRRAGRARRGARDRAVDDLQPAAVREARFDLHRRGDDARRRELRSGLLRRSRSAPGTTRASTTSRAVRSRSRLPRARSGRARCTTSSTTRRGSRSSRSPASGERGTSSSPPTT